MSAADPSVRFHRQLDLLPPDACDVPVTIIGAGAVGSFVALSLAKMGLRDLTVWDDDHIELHNAPNEFVRLSDVGRLKVEALADLVRAFDDVEIREVPRRFEGGPLAGIVISAVDSMAARRVIWDSVKFDAGVRLYIDARMGGLVSITRPVRPCDAGDVRRYETTLHSDEEAAPEPCSARAIMFTVLAIASTIARLVRMELVGRPLPRDITQDHEIGLLVTS